MKLLCEEKPDFLFFSGSESKAGKYNTPFLVDLLQDNPVIWRTYCMDQDTKEMLKKVIIYDGAIFILALAISLITFREYAPILIIALLLSFANFILNAFITSITFRSTGRAALIVVGTVVRVSVTAVVAVLLCRNNLSNFVAFLLGYGLHYIAVIIYSTTRGRQKIKKEVVK